jgi:hypothetical protein
MGTGDQGTAIFLRGALHELLKREIRVELSELSWILLTSRLKHILTSLCDTDFQHQLFCRPLTPRRDTLTSGPLPKVYLYIKAEIEYLKAAVMLVIFVASHTLGAGNVGADSDLMLAMFSTVTSRRLTCVHTNVVTSQRRRHCCEEVKRCMT